MSDTLELASLLISKKSLSPDDAGCQDIISQRLQKLGFAIEHLPFNDVSNLWATHGYSKPMVVFAGHTDVVPSGPEHQWSSPPFEPTHRDGNLYGRGAADMKSSLAAMVTATERFIKTHPNHQGCIAFLITSDEEALAINGTKKVVEHLMQKGTEIDYCIVGEASSDKVFGDTIKVGRRGSFHGELTIHGVQAHIAYPHKGENPIHRSTKFLDKLCNIVWDHGNEVFQPTSFQISNIHAGTGADNVIPGLLKLQFNLRYSPEITPDEIKSRITALLDEEKLKYDIEWKLTGEPYMTREGKLTQAVSKAIHYVTEITPTLSTTGGTSDGRFISKMGCEVIECGPINASIHKIDEHINMDDLEKLSQVYEQCLKYLLTHDHTHFLGD